MGAGVMAGLSCNSGVLFLNGRIVAKVLVTVAVGWTTVESKVVRTSSVVYTVLLDSEGIHQAFVDDLRVVGRCRKGCDQGNGE